MIFLFFFFRFVSFQMFWNSSVSTRKCWWSRNIRRICRFGIVCNDCTRPITNVIHLFFFFYFFSQFFSKLFRNRNFPSVASFDSCFRIQSVNFTFLWFCYQFRAYPVYVNEYASGTQQQYYTTNESYSATGNHQGETYSIVPVEEALLASQSRESPQAISAVSWPIYTHKNREKEEKCFNIL